jgi:hypothetical protein
MHRLAWTYTSCEARITDACHHTQLLVETGLVNFLPGLALNQDPHHVQAARITGGVSHPVHLLHSEMIYRCTKQQSQTSSTPFSCSENHTRLLCQETC